MSCSEFVEKQTNGKCKIVKNNTALSNGDNARIVSYLCKNIPERTNGVRTTVTVYNNVNSDYVKENTNRLNDRLNENENLRKQNNQNKKGRK